MKNPKEKHLNLTMVETAELFHVSAATISNWVRGGYLDLDDNRRVSQDSIKRFKTKYAGKIKLQARANKLLKDEHDVAEVGRAIQKELCDNTFDDAIGNRYEAMLSESYKNKEGITYTPKAIVDDMMRDVRVDKTTLFLDPCCGSGNFLVKAIEMGVAPDHVYGFDTDPNAVAIARRRIKEMTGEEVSHVVCADFLQECLRLNTKFDLVFTNPPWGKKLTRTDRMRYANAFCAGTGNDTCSLFLFAIFSVLKPEGIAGLLMPESFFKIAAYEEARKAVLQRTIIKIKDYGKPFKNMYSAASIIICQKAFQEDYGVVCGFGKTEHVRPQSSFMRMPRHNLNYWTRTEEMHYIEKLMDRPHLTLKDHAVWGLGIVTGNNAKMCKRSRWSGLKPVYRGKDILPGKLLPSGLYINPNVFPRCQQVAPMALFHAPEKLIYRFISSELVFYCDTRQRYILNSANMLVLHDDFPLSASQLADIMNSPLTNWLFKQLFNTHKILRSDLELLPIFTDSSLHRRFNLLDFNR